MPKGVVFISDDTFWIAAGSLSTAAMTIATYWLGRQSKRAVEEPKKTEIERAFHRLFSSLRKDILRFDDLHFRYAHGNLMVTDFSDTENTKKKLCLICDVEFTSFDKIESLTEILLLPVELLRRIWAVEEKIRNNLNSIRVMANNNTQFESRLINQDIPRAMLSVRLYQRQLACYFIQEALKQGYKKMSTIMAEVSEFKPDIYLQNINFFLPEYGLPPEPEDYCLCKVEKLVAQAKQESDSRHQALLNSLVRNTE